MTVYTPYNRLYRIYRVGQNHIFIRIYGVHTVFLAGKSPYIWSYTVCIYGSGQPYVYKEILTYSELIHMGLILQLLKSFAHDPILFTQKMKGWKVTLTQRRSKGKETTVLQKMPKFKGTLKSCSVLSSFSIQQTSTFLFPISPPPHLLLLLLPPLNQINQGEPYLLI